jgi:hypothetical protein
MRRRARHLFTLCSATSLLLCVAVCVLWARSYWAEEAIDNRWPHSVSGAMVSRGVFSVHRIWPSHPDQIIWAGEESSFGWSHETAELPYGRVYRRAEPNGRDWEVGWAGVRVAYTDEGDAEPGRWELWPRKGWEATLPCWVAAAGLLVVPAWRGALVFKRRRRSRAGLCAACGYDLRATPGRCPECGTPGATGVA